MSGPRAIVFLDFDGTITCRDATDAILEAFADPAWLEVEKDWLAGRIGSRECLAAQMGLVTASQTEVDQLLDQIAVDPGLPTLFDVCAARQVPVHIISDGFDYCIRRILARPALNLVSRLTGVQIVSSGLRRHEGRWVTAFRHPQEPCAHGCATCKPRAMEKLNATSAFTMFAGDGMSDRYAAVCASVVFAKDRLATYCESAAIPYRPYDTLAAVAADIDRLLSNGLQLPQALSGRAFPTV